MAAPSIDENSPVNSFTHAEETSDDIRALTFHTKWGEQGVGTGATIYYSFPKDDQLWSRKYNDIPQDTDQPFGDPTFVAAMPAQINAARESIQAWGNVANIEFIEVTTETRAAVGDIRVYNINYSSLEDIPLLAFGVPPIDIQPWEIASGDLGFILNSFENELDTVFSAGEKGYQVMLHEIGHTLGLSHPFFEERDPDIPLHEDHIALSADKDHYQYTVMSYSDMQFTNYYSSPTFYPTSPMLLDIQAIQYLYGANMHYQTGDNTYAFGESYAYEAIWDAGGVDAIKNISSWDSVINLNAGEFSSIGPSVKAHKGISAQTQNNIAIAYGVTIENATGGQGNDIIYGNGVSNVIDGGDGADTYITEQKRGDITSIIQLENGEILLSSATQQDILTNIEKVNFANEEHYITELLGDVSSSPVYIVEKDENKTPVHAKEYEGTVSYLQFEHLGSEQSESLIAADTNDFINLLAGDDAAQGGGGNDVLDGGIGSNFLTGGYGTDIFFIDGRSHQTTWSTITDFDGDSVNIWGWVDGISQVVLEEINGADGYQGYTLHMDLDGDNEIDTSITFTGLAAQDIATRESASVEGNGYLLMTG